jgi:ribokinase
MVRVVAAGHVNWDVTLRVNSLPERDGEARIVSQHHAGGGSAANVACALAGLGTEARLIGSVGNDGPGTFARRELETAGVDLGGVSVIEGVETTVKYLLVDESGEVMVLANEGANEAIGPDDLDATLLDGVAHLHLTSQRPATAVRLYELAAPRDIPVSFDPGRRLTDREYGDLLDRVDVLFLNDREAEQLCADRGTEPAGLVRDSRRGVVVKHGSAGATVYTADGTWTHPGFEVDPVDTTGAGDAFAAGFLWVIVERGSLDPGFDGPQGFERALTIGNACGALAARREGARTVLDVETLSSFLETRSVETA